MQKNNTQFLEQKKTRLFFFQSQVRLSGQRSGEMEHCSLASGILQPWSTCLSYPPLSVSFSPLWGSPENGQRLPNFPANSQVCSCMNKHTLNFINIHKQTSSIVRLGMGKKKHSLFFYSRNLCYSFACLLNFYLKHLVLPTP